jgi:IS5 family transposase
MSILPPFVQSLLVTYLEPLLHWFSDRIYADLLKRADDHFLVKLYRHLDFTRLEQACAGYHHAGGPGSPPTHPVARLVRAELVGALYGWSLRQLEQQIRFNLVVKWFVGYALYEAGPDHVTLERFELWACDQAHRNYFDEVLRQIDQDFPEERQVAQLGDTFAVRAQAARENLGDLIQHTCRLALRTLQRVAPTLEAAIAEQLQVPALFGPEQNPHAFRLTLAERARRLQTRVEAAQACAQWVTTALTTVPNLAPEARRAVTLWLTRLEKILADELTFADPPAAVPVPATEPVTPAEPALAASPVEPAPLYITEAKDKGPYRLGSATDPEATYRVHGEEEAKTEFGYNPQVLTTTQFVREIEAHTGARPDAVTIAPALQAQQQYQGLTPPKLIYDAAAGTGKVHAQVAEVTQGQTQLVAPLLPYEKRTNLFTPDQFSLSPDGQTLTCPQGCTTDIAYRHPLGGGRTFRFMGPVCRACPLWEKCRTQKPNSKAMRQVFISDYRPEAEAARIYAQTNECKVELRQRATVERIIAALVRYNGARQARRRGLKKTDFQMKMAATAYNLKKWMRLLDQRAAAARLQIQPRVESAC